jgi:hypothetical protein
MLLLLQFQSFGASQHDGNNTEYPCCCGSDPGRQEGAPKIHDATRVQSKPKEDELAEIVWVAAKRIGSLLGWPHKILVSVSKGGPVPAFGMVFVLVGYRFEEEASGS